MGKQVSSIFSEIIRDFNETSNRMLNSTIRNAEILEHNLYRCILQLSNMLKASSNPLTEKHSNDGNSFVTMNHQVINPKQHYLDENTFSSSAMEDINSKSLISNIKMENSHEIPNSDDRKNSIKTMDIPTINNSNSYNEELFSIGEEGTIDSANVIQAFRCNQCSYKSSTKSNFNRHIKIVHEKIKNYECDECDYKTFQKGHLAGHVHAVHERKRNVV